ncbi:MAG: copper chaperone PCu(A)C [Thiotrichaceae bacterium]|nr:copper chaperone PCu(A)C [Thiotrichaceae bacterium]
MKKILFLAFLLVSSSAFAENDNVQFIDGWIKQLPPVVPMRAGYMQIKNDSEQPMEIISLKSDAFETVEMHETKMEDGMMKMIELETIPLSAQSIVELKPGGKHLMLIAPIEPLQIGDIVKVIATFSNDSTQSFELEVKK